MLLCNGVCDDLRRLHLSSVFLLWTGLPCFPQIPSPEVFFDALGRLGWAWRHRAHRGIQPTCGEQRSNSSEGCRREKDSTYFRMGVPETLVRELVWERGVNGTCAKLRTVPATSLGCIFLVWVPINF